MEELDFQILKINSVIHSHHINNWQAKKLCSKTSFVMFIALDGEATYLINNDVITVKADDLLIFPPGYVRSGYSNSHKCWSFININFDLAYNDAAKHFFEQPYLHFKGVEKYLLNKFKEISSSWESKNKYYHIKCRNLVSDILYKLLIKQASVFITPYSKKIEYAKSFIQSNFKNKIEINALANEIGLSNSYFRKLFNQAFSISPKQYITFLRISMAQDLLISGEVSISEIAQIVGFDDIYYFSKIFKSHTGYSPTEYIKYHENIY